MPTDIFIVFVLSEDNQSTTPYWIDADNRTAARRRALKLVGKGSFKIVSVTALDKLVAGALEKGKTKKRSKKKAR